MNTAPLLAPRRLSLSSRGLKPTFKQTTRLALMGLALAAASTAPAQAQGRGQAQANAPIDLGQREFRDNCAACHGMDAKGRGPVAGFLTKNPPDLTRLSRDNGGIFPINRLYQVIDGTEPGGQAAEPGPHGNREMPIWGRDYRVRDAEYFGDMAYNADMMLRSRLLLLLEYLNRIQVK